ncbi:LOW QUALITY PROTEIN: hypothetical protein V2J09_003993 [Rumex salicifolius]
MRLRDTMIISICMRGCVRTLGLDIHYRRPGVVRLQVHMPGEQCIMFDDDDNLDEAKGPKISRLILISNIISLY